MILAGVAVGVTVLVLTIKGFTETDATIEADGQSHRISVATRQDRMVWIHDAEPPSCTIRRHRDG